MPDAAAEVSRGHLTVTGFKVSCPGCPQRAERSKGLWSSLCIWFALTLAPGAPGRAEAAELWLSLELPGSELLGWAGASFFSWGWAALPVHQADKLDSSRGEMLLTCSTDMAASKTINPNPVLGHWGQKARGTHCHAPKIKNQHKNPLGE